MRIQPVDNQEPRVTVGPAVEVLEGGSVVLPPSTVMATDADTPPTELRIIIDAPPIFGYITNTLAGEGERERCFFVCLFAQVHSRK